MRYLTGLQSGTCGLRKIIEAKALRESQECVESASKDKTVGKLETFEMTNRN